MYLYLRINFVAYPYDMHPGGNSGVFALLSPPLKRAALRQKIAAEIIGYQKKICFRKIIP